MTTGERIKIRRKELFLSAEELAAQVGVSPATIYRYEKGDIEKVPGDFLLKVGKALRTSPSYLMGWENVPEQSIQTELSRDEKTIVESYRSVTEQGKEYIRQQVHVATQLYAGDKPVSSVEKIK